MTDPKSDHRLKILEGNLVYTVPPEEIQIDDMIPETARLNRFRRDGDSYYITIVTKSEFQISDNQLDMLRKKYDWSNFVTIGIGITLKEESKSYYQIVWYPIAKKIRDLLKLPTKDFHITLGFEPSDVLDSGKGMDFLVKPDPNLIDSIEPFIMDLTDDQRRSVIGILARCEDDKNRSPKAQQLRMKIHYYLKEYDICLSLIDAIDDPEDPNYIDSTKAYLYLKKKEIYNGIYFLNKIPEDKRDRSWDSLMADAKYRAVGQPKTYTRTYIDIWDEKIELSRNFSWLIPLKVAGISIPKSADQIRAFKHANIGLIITVMGEQLPTEWFEEIDVEYAHYAVENHGTPTIEEMDGIIQKMEDMIRNQKGVLIHCDNGKGRTGTIFSCFVAKHGISGDLQDCPQMRASEAIAYVRELRPGSIESEKQELFISDYVDHLYKPI